VGFGLGLVLLLATAGQAAPLDGYNVGLFAPATSRTVGAPSWQTYVATSALTCKPLADLNLNPNPPSPLVAVVAEGIVVGFASETVPTDWCFTAPLLPPTPGDYEVSVQRVVTTSSGTVTGAWTVAIPQLHLQLEYVVPCQVSGWFDWSEWSPWGPITTLPPIPNAEERTRTRTRNIINTPSGGGTPCPALTQTERETHGVPEPATAVFVKADGTTHGAWQYLYGHQGAVMVGLDLPPPEVATITPEGALTWVWAYSTTDPRALVKPGLPEPANGAPPEGISATWYSPTSFVVDIKFRDTDQHQIAVYMIDWDARARRQTVTVLDTMENALVPSQEPLTGFAGGVYFIYLVSGHVRLRFLNDSSQTSDNSVVSAVFLDPPSVTPIACVVSNWTEGVWGPWVPLNTTTEQRTRTDTREVTTPASGGGTACPPLSETRTEERPIATLNLTSIVMTQCLVSVTAPPPPDTAPGWIAAWYVDSANFALDATAPYSGLVQVSIGNHSFHVRWTRPENRSWWRRLFAWTRATGTGAVTYDPVTFVCGV
jgi:hypothetical protein